MSTSIDEILYRTYEDEPHLDESLKLKVSEAIQGNKIRITSLPRKIVLVAACVTLFLGLSVTAYAVYQYLTPTEVAVQVQAYTIADAFEQQNAVKINTSQVDEDVKVTLLGYIPSIELEAVEAFATQVDYNQEAYIVIAIENLSEVTVGSIAGEYFVTPIIEGLNPIMFNTATMNGHYNPIIHDGIEYRLIGLDSLEIFSSRTIKLGVTSTMFYDQNAFIYDYETGEIDVNSNYTGVNLLFDLPLDKNIGDEKAIEEYILGIYPEYYETLERSVDKSVKEIPKEENFHLDAIPDIILYEEISATLDNKYDPDILRLTNSTFPPLNRPSILM